MLAFEVLNCLYITQGYGLNLPEYFMGYTSASILGSRQAESRDLLLRQSCAPYVTFWSICGDARMSASKQGVPRGYLVSKQFTCT